MGCRQPWPKARLIRLVRRADGTVTLDASAGNPGRGAYVCASDECVTRGLRRDRLAHAFRKPCHVPAELEPAVRMIMSAGDAVSARPVE